MHVVTHSKQNFFDRPDQNFRFFIPAGYGIFEKIISPSSLLSLGAEKISIYSKANKLKKDGFR